MQKVVGLIDVSDLGPFGSVSGTLIDLHWLSIEQRIEYKLCLLNNALRCW